MGSSSHPSALVTLPQQVFIARSLAWVNVMVGGTPPQRTDRLLRWREWVLAVYAHEQAAEARRFLDRIGAALAQFPSWSGSDTDATQAATWQWPPADEDRNTSDERLRRNLERYEQATAGIVETQQPLLRNLAELLREEQLRLDGADSRALTPAPGPSGDLSPEYLALVAATWSMPHYAPTGVSGRGWERALRVDRGLTEAELAIAEARCGFRFPPDLRSLLQYAVPIDDGFVDWRDAAALQRVVDDWADLRQGIWGDIDQRQQPYFALNAANEWELVTPAFTPWLWSPAWGPVPPDRDAAYAVLAERLAHAPRLIPLRYNCSIPDEPQAGGNPVYSIRFTDIIPHGNDLADYLYQEFGVPRPAWAAAARKEITFWSELVRLNDG